MDNSIKITDSKGVSAVIHFHDLVEWINEGIFCVNSEGIIIYANKQFCKNLDYTEAELIGHPIFKFFYDAHYAGMSQEKLELRRKGVSDVYDIKMRRKDGEAVWIRVSGKPIFNDDGAFVGSIAIHSDITRQKLLVEKVKLRTEELEEANKKLQQQIDEKEKIQDELRHSNEGLERFAYVASHDLQSPLRTIASYLQLLEVRYGDKLDSEAKEFIDFSVGGAKRMQAVIQELLNYSRIATEKTPLNKTDFNILVADVTKDMHSLIKATNTKIKVGPLPVINVNRGQVQQLFHNLIDNAIKFVKGNEPVINISAVEHADDWEFSVSDNGIGIKSEFKDKIFQIFQRLHTETEYPGIGVGLAISKKIVELHHGKIQVDSEYGKGTTFRFTISKHL